MSSIVLSRENCLSKRTCFAASPEAPRAQDIIEKQIRKKINQKAIDFPFFFSLQVLLKRITGPICMNAKACISRAVEKGFSVSLKPASLSLYMSWLFGLYRPLSNLIFSIWTQSCRGLNSQSKLRRPWHGRHVWSVGPFACPLGDVWQIWDSILGNPQCFWLDDWYIDWKQYFISGSYKVLILQQEEVHAIFCKTHCFCKPVKKRTQGLKGLHKWHQGQYPI